MNQDPEREKYAKAKIEPPEVRLPQATLKPDDDPIDDLCYIRIFDNTQNAQHVADTDASGAKLDRKVYRIRNKELVKVLGEDSEGMLEVQRASKATIGILANAESNLHSHSFLDLVGTTEEVKTAEQLILDKVLKTYSSLTFPIILMPPTVYGDNIIISLHDVVVLLGTSNTNLLWIEKATGSWIKIEAGPCPGGSELDRVVNVFGPQENVDNAVGLMLSVLCEDNDLTAPEALNELLSQLKEPNRVELIKGKEKRRYELKLKRGQTILRPKRPSEGSTSKQTEGVFKVPRWSQTFGHGKSEGSSKQMEKQQAEEGGSGVTEKEKQPENVLEEGQDLKEEKKEDVEEASKSGDKSG